MIMKKAAIFLLVAFLTASQHRAVVAFIAPHQNKFGAASSLSFPKADGDIKNNSNILLRRPPLVDGLPGRQRATWTTTHLSATNPKNKNQEPRRGPVVNFSLVRQTLLNQALIGFTIWTGGYGAQVLVENAQFDTNALAFGIAGVVPLIIFSRFIERSEAPAVADLNLSTNMLVLRLFGDKPQPVVAFVVSALLAAVTGLVEETTFRGQVLPALAEKLDSLPASIVLSTLLFAVLHINPIALFRGGGEGAKDAAVLVAYQIVTGSVFAALLLLTDNLAVPIIAHALFDCYVFFATHLQVTSQMQYARSEALMPVAPAGVEAKWRQRRGDGFLLVARESFYLADSNRDGVLSRPELRIALYSYGIRLTAEESAAVTRAADRDRSGAIDFGEFLEYVGPSGSPGNAIKNSLLGVNG